MDVAMAWKELVLQRLNLDSTWRMEWNSTSFMIDPWLTGEEVDIARWFNTQWHNTEPVDFQALDIHQPSIVTQSYSDHCHENTLLQLKGDIYAVPKALKRLAKEKALSSRLKALPPWGKGALKLGDFSIGYLDPGRRMDPVYYALVVAVDEKLLIYAPHGFRLTDEQMQSLRGYEVSILMTTLITYQLPSLLGGFVNPGLDAAADLARQLKPTYILATHDEDKKASGLVSKLAKVTRPSRQEIEARFPSEPMWLYSENLDSFRPFQRQSSK